MVKKIYILDEYYRGPMRHWRQQWQGSSVSSMKVDGFHFFSTALARDLSIQVVHRSANLDDSTSLSVDKDSDIVIIVPAWTDATKRGNNLSLPLSRLRECHPNATLAIFDTVDQCSSPFIAALPYVDVYLKSQLMINQQTYVENPAGGSLLTEWVQKKLNFDLGDWFFGAQCDADSLTKLMCGWNMGISRYYSRVGFVALALPKPWNRREIEINARFGIPEPGKVSRWEWYQEYRRFAGLEVRAHENQFRLTDVDFINQRQYLREMMNSKIVFSPFGWGEVCFRDFEAIACGSVLVKPDMSHLETSPDVFDAGVTYIPVKWDLSDFGEKCEWVLSHAKEAQQIVHNARQRMCPEALKSTFLSDIERLTTHAKVQVRVD